LIARFVLPHSFVWPVRVYWEDTDAGGVVYYANYLKFMERARTEWLRSFGLEQGPLKDEHDLMFVILDTEAHYKSPAKYGDLLQVTCLLAEHTRTSITFAQDIYRSTLAGELLVQGKSRAACVSATTLKPQRIPATLLKEFS
jgi:acyl-CoA thioester hydrolase